jgi:hypothetical protein
MCRSMRCERPCYAEPPGCYWACQPVYDAAGRIVGYTGQPVQVCPGYVPPPPPGYGGSLPPGYGEAPSPAAPPRPRRTIVNGPVIGRMRATLMVSSATALTEANAMNVAAINLHHIAQSLFALSPLRTQFRCRHHLFTEIRLGPTVQRKPCLLRCMSPRGTKRTNCPAGHLSAAKRDLLHMMTPRLPLIAEY